jgi:hypothetical protein
VGPALINTNRAEVSHGRKLHRRHPATGVLVDRLGRGDPRSQLPEPDPEELIENLRSALNEALEMNRADALEACQGAYEEVSLSA